ncbi:MAG: glycosyl transferase [Gammaproteobacteria bacterium]|nr:MAG: glycosyl transferase [Gammaproteobacteria bacterium]RLA57281.1 MAG: glycosyl transferase [Gammaproteobacteria bacterium]
MTVLLITLLLSAALCGLYLLLARRWQILDTPNERSSHQQPTPHGGGVPMLLAFAAGLLLAASWRGAWDGGFITLALAALFLMLLGVIDDLRGLSVRLRFTVYGLLCLLVAATLLSPVLVDSIVRGGVLVVLAATAMLWSLNLYNFMDGIDGIAAIQCIVACCGAALLAWGAGGDGSYALFCLLLAASHLGFLLWNWPPARLFMGDAGSIPTGFLLAGLALLGAVQGQLNPLCWLVLLAVFVTDASWTLVWRIVSGQRFTQPHRLHAYQRLSRHRGSHLELDILLLSLNALWLTPLAWVVQTWPDYGFLLVILAYLPLLWGMAKTAKFT